jgi:hypothetical protein
MSRSHNLPTGVEAPVKRANPSIGRRLALRARFDRIFRYRTVFVTLVPLHIDFDRLTAPWFQCGQVGTINQDSDIPGHPRAP